MSDLRQTLITKYDAIMAVKKYLDDEDRLQGKEPNEKHNRWRAEVILEGTTVADTPQTDEIGDCNSCEYLGDLRCGMCTNGSGYRRRADTPQDERNE